MRVPTDGQCVRRRIMRMIKQDTVHELWPAQATQDGSFVSSGYRSVAASDILEAPFVIAEHRDVFHVGPVNMKRTLVAVFSFFVRQFSIGSTMLGSFGFVETTGLKAFGQSSECGWFKRQQQQRHDSKMTSKKYSWLESKLYHFL